MGDVATLFRKARQIIADGGDPAPCELGPYCLRCCLAIAQTDLQGQRGDGPEGVASFLPPGRHPSDARLLEAVRIVRERHGDSGTAHTRESALSVLDAAMQGG